MNPLLERVDALRREANRDIDAERKAELGQFLTPAPVAKLMASMFKCTVPDVSILDAGAGVGSLFAAVVAELGARIDRPRRISVEAYEIDAVFVPYLKRTAELCDQFCREQGVEFSANLLQADFIRHHEEVLFLRAADPRFDCVILNPPYRKIRSESGIRKALRNLGIETGNLYAGFVALAMYLLKAGGELVAITPRSFCNGPYFKPFREAFLRNLAMKRIHVYEARDAAFRDDDVLQENIIVHAVRSPAIPAVVEVTSSQGASDECCKSSFVPYDRVVPPDDPDLFIHLPLGRGELVSHSIQRLPLSLQELRMSVSTGRVVDFRARELLRSDPEQGCVPLIYPCHVSSSGINWPRKGKKPNAIVVSDRAGELLVPNANYVLVKRFSTKEERRRIVACVYEAAKFSYPLVGFENHLNYFHENGRGLSLELAWGLAAFLNSSVVDHYFRLFSGHTQVNAADLRKLRYPTREQLQEIGRKLERDPGQQDAGQAMDILLSLKEDTAAT